MSLKVRRGKPPSPVPGCPLATCMNLLGGAWTPNVIWHLSDGPRRFSELRRDMPVSAKVLTARLRDLEGKGVLTRAVLPTSPPSVEYALTPLGRELMPAIRAIVEIGHRLKQARASGVHQGGDEGVAPGADVAAAQALHQRTPALDPL